MPRKLDYIDEIIKQGARVLPPKPKPEPVSEISTEIAPEISIKDVAAKLDKHFHTPEFQPESNKAQPTQKYPEYENAEPVIGDVIDLVVVAFSRYDPTGRERGGIGLARIPRGTRMKGRRDGCHFLDRDIISEGVETLRPGSRIRARLADPTSDGHPFTLKDIEIYQE